MLTATTRNANYTSILVYIHVHMYIQSELSTLCFHYINTIRFKPMRFAMASLLFIYFLKVVGRSNLSTSIRQVGLFILSNTASFKDMDMRFSPASETFCNPSMVFKTNRMSGYRNS